MLSVSHDRVIVVIMGLTDDGYLLAETNVHGFLRLNDGTEGCLSAETLL